MILSRSVRFLPDDGDLHRRFAPLTIRLFLRVKWEFADKPFLYACGGALLSLLIKTKEPSLAFQFVCLLDSNKGCHKQTYLDALRFLDKEGFSDECTLVFDKMRRRGLATSGEAVRIYSKNAFG